MNRDIPLTVVSPTSTFVNTSLYMKRRNIIFTFQPHMATMRAKYSSKNLLTTHSPNFARVQIEHGQVFESNNIYNLSSSFKLTSYG